VFDLVRALIDAWVIATMLAATGWIVTDFDVRASREWAAALIMVPAMAWSLVLASLDLWRVAGHWPGAAWALMAGF